MSLFIKNTLYILFLCFIQITAIQAMPNNELTNIDTSITITSQTNTQVREGLFFYSFETDKDRRTGLDLTPDKKLYLPKGFTLEFDIKFRVEIQNFGYIFRILGDDNSNVDFVSDYYPTNDGIIFSLLGQQDVLIKTKISDVGSNAFDNWLNIKLKIDPESNKLTLSLNETVKEVDFQSGASKYDIFFGGNITKHPNITDVPPVTVRNIRIYNEKQQLIRHWKLGKHNVNCVYDECGQYKATATSPYWMIDNHTKWKLEDTLPQAGLFTQYAFDPLRERIFLVSRNEVQIYSIHTKTLESIVPKRGIPFNIESNQLLYDSINNELISYDFKHTYLSRFNFNTHEWTNYNEEKIGPAFGHHGKYYMPQEKKIVAFGGYGFHVYNSKLHIYSEEEGMWQSFELAESIPPRYLGAMGQLNTDQFLYFGGFGNFTGKQKEDLPRNFYDLYEVNIRDRSVRKIWDIETVKEPFASANSMIINREGDAFYSLSFMNHRNSSTAFLHEYSLTTLDYRTVGDSIPYLFYDVQSYADLYLSRDNRNLYALLSEARDGNTTATVYSIAYPPMSPEDVMQTPPQKASWLWYLLLLLVFPLLFIAWRKRKQQIVLPPDEAELSAEIILAPVPIQQLPSSIYLLGEFTIINAEGNNIGANFTPTTRQVFLLLLLYTFKDGLGISSNDLRNILWEEKDDVSARNVRNVYINKVRNLAKEMDGLEIVKTDGYWKVNLSSQVYCDYARVKQLIYTLQNEGFNKSHLIELLDITSRGKLLPYVEVEWLDDIKSNYSNELIDFLIEVSKSNVLKNDYNTLLKISNTILIYDSVEEYAVKLKCYILKQLKGNREIRLCYQKYADDYEKLYSVKPDITLEELTNFK